MFEFLIDVMDAAVTVVAVVLGEKVVECLIIRGLHRFDAFDESCDDVYLFSTVGHDAGEDGVVFFDQAGEHLFVGLVFLLS